jgi:hypothetical protein
VIPRLESLVYGYDSCNSNMHPYRPYHRLYHQTHRRLDRPSRPGRLDPQGNCLLSIFTGRAHKHEGKLIVLIILLPWRWDLPIVLYPGAPPQYRSGVSQLPTSQPLKQGYIATPVLPISTSSCSCSRRFTISQALAIRSQRKSDSI